MEQKKVSIPKLLLHKFWKPQHLWKIYRLQKNRKKNQHVYDDAQLKLYHKIMPGDFLHYGYFVDPAIEPAEISLAQFYRAQEVYAENIIDLISDKNNPILDVGCGMGGLLRIMNARNLQAIGLTPDVNQIKHIEATYPNKVMACRFEDMPANDYPSYFGTVLTSESLQYLNLSEALPLIQKVLKPGGKWVACDYFKLGEAGEKSGHNFSFFEKQLKENGFAITYQKDITPHILPTISFVHLWATQVVQPLLQFGIEKLQVKAPGIYYGVQDGLPEINAKIQKNIDTVDPVLFAKHKKYVLMVIERM
jgi:cyclopropane fatty-acyl-phospholipid synthase-like methyltransferase